MNRNIRSGRVDHYVTGNFKVKVNIQTTRRPGRDVREIILARMRCVVSKVPCAIRWEVTISHPCYQ